MPDELVTFSEKPNAKYLIAGWRRQWSDGGRVSGGLTRYLIEKLGAKKIGEMSPTVSHDCYPFQVAGTHDTFRPLAAYEDGLPTKDMYRENYFYDAGNGLIIFRGEEPWFHIEIFGQAFFQAISELGIQTTVAVEEGLAKKIGEMSPTVSHDCYPFQVAGTHDTFRPLAAYEDGLPTKDMYRENYFYDAGNGLIIFRGEEPWFHIEIFGQAFFQAISELGIQTTVAVEGVNGPVPPEMERRVTCVYSKAEMKEDLEKIGVQFSSYGSEGRRGPTIAMALVTLAHFEHPDVDMFRLGSMAPMYPFSTNTNEQVGITRDHRSYYDIMRRLKAKFDLNIDLSELQELGEAESHDIVIRTVGAGDVGPFRASGRGHVPLGVHGSHVPIFHQHQRTGWNNQGPPFLLRYHAPAEGQVRPKHRPFGASGTGRGRIAAIDRNPGEDRLQQPGGQATYRKREV